jgi:hypothetical protein
LLSCVEIRGFRVLSTATKLTTVAVLLVTLESRGTTPKSELQRSLEHHTSP